MDSMPKTDLGKLEEIIRIARSLADDNILIGLGFWRDVRKLENKMIGLGYDPETGDLKPWIDSRDSGKQND